MKKRKLPFKYKLEYAALVFVRFLAMALPVRLSEWTGRRLGDLAWYFFPYRLQVMLNNMDIVFPEMSLDDKLRLAHKIYRFFGEMIVRFFSQNKKANRTFIMNARIIGREYLDQALSKGKGVILTALHSGNWEYVASWLNMSGIETSGIYKIMKNPLSDKFFLNLRFNMGDALHMISTRSGMKAYEKALRNNHVLAVAVDQNAHDKGAKVKFFNRTTSVAKGTAVLKYRTDAEILGVIPHREKGHFSIRFFPIQTTPMNVLNEQTIQCVMQEIMNTFEPFVVRYPGQWMWFHKLWGKPTVQFRRTLWQILKY